MHQEEFKTNRPGDEKKYQERLDYENMLRYQVMSVGQAINAGYDGYNATQVLLTMLIPELYEPIKDDVERARNHLAQQVKKVQNYKSYSMVKVVGANTRAMQDQQYIASQVADFKRDYSLSIMEMVIQTLHDNAMLLSQERRLDEGGY